MNSLQYSAPRNPKRLARALTGVGILAVGLATAAGSASATNEFPANPAATISTSCSTWLGATIQISYSNIGGVSDAFFSTSVGGVAVTAQDVAGNNTASYSGQIAEGVAVAVSISAPDMAPIQTSVGPVNCHSGTSTIHVDCVGNVPTMTATATNTGPSMTAAIFVVDGNNEAPDIASVVPGETKTFTSALTDGAAYTGSIRFDKGYGIESTVSGTAACAPPATIPTTTIPATTIPVTTPETTTPVMTTVPSSTVPPSTVLVDAPTTIKRTAPTGSVLPSTGGSSGPIAWTGSIVLAFGFAAVRFARRQRRMR